MTNNKVPKISEKQDPIPNKDARMAKGTKLQIVGNDNGYGHCFEVGQQVTFLYINPDESYEVRGVHPMDNRTEVTQTVRPCDVKEYLALDEKKHSVLSEDDLLIIKNAIKRHPINSEQVANIIMLSAIALENEIDAENELINIINKKLNVNILGGDRNVFLLNDEEWENGI